MKEASEFTSQMAGWYHGGKIEVRTDSIHGELIGILNIP